MARRRKGERVVKSGADQAHWPHRATSRKAPVSTFLTRGQGTYRISVRPARAALIVHELRVEMTCDRPEPAPLSTSRAF